MTKKIEVTNSTHVLSADTNENAPLSADVQDNIGRQLRSHYESLVSEPLPDKLRNLLDMLAEAEPDGGVTS